ncbi:Gfo/Idh/MocA family oxidoreductase [bacterium]|nr:Gfo/Idh/MocA family oxidoreductase [bacterium]
MFKEQCDRRGFLRRTAGFAGLFHIIPASALGRNGRLPPSDRIGIGCIGLGGQGTHNMRAFLAQSDVQLTGLCDVNSGSDDYDMLYQFPGSHSAGLSHALRRAVEFSEETGVSLAPKSVFCCRDFRELLMRPDVDAVCVCTPDHWHGLISIAAAGAGKDIYCEKPLVNSIAEGRALCRIVERQGRILQTGSHERSNDSVRFAWELVQNGRIGRLEEIIVHMPAGDPHHIRMIKMDHPVRALPVPGYLDYDLWLGPASWSPYAPERCFFWWRFILEYGGGEMTDRGAHILDLAQFMNLADETGPVEIRANGRRIGPGLYDSFIDYHFECRYANGVLLRGSSEGERGLRLKGTKGSLFIAVHGGRLTADPPGLLSETLSPGERMAGRSPGHHRDFLNAVRFRRQPVAPAEAGHRTSTLCHLINAAMILKRPLVWDPENETVVGDSDARRLILRPMRPPWQIVG